MSHELLLVAGPADPALAAHRRRLVEDAARQVPRQSGVEVHETPHACLGVVATAPSGGDVVDVTTSTERLTATLALSDAGVVAARAPDGRPGAEAAHVCWSVGEDGSVRLTTDGFATVSSYFATVDGQLLATTHLASLVSLGHPATLDETGLLEYLAMLHPLGDRTILSDARLVGPGATVDFDDGTVRVSARPLFMPHDPGRSDDATVAEFRRVWTDVVGDLITRSEGRRMLVGLSGGLDSRAVVAEMAVQGHRPLTYTYGTRHNREVVAAMAVAERLAMPHVTVPVADQRLLDNAAEATELLDGAHAPTEMYELWFEDRLRALSDVVVNGLAGGPLWGDDKLMGLRDRDMLAARAWSRYREGTRSVATFLEPPLRGEIASVVQSSLAQSFEPFSDVDRADVGIFWRIANRQLRWGNNLMTALRRMGIRPETPFLDGRFLHFAAGLTPDQRRHGRLYLRVQQEVFATVAGLPRSDDGNSPDELDHVYWTGDESYASQLAGLARRHPVAATRRAGRRGLGVAAAQLRERAGIARPADHLETKSLVFPADAWARTRPVYARRLAAMLDDAAEASGVLDAAAIARSADNLRSGRGGLESAVALGKVAAAGAWLHDFDRRLRAARDL